MSKITAYSPLTSPQPDDVLVIVDVHDASMAPTGTDKKITVASLGVPAWYNVKSAAYGAKGDGTTDDTSALQAALTAARAAGGGVVYVPAGTYLASQSLQIGSNTTLVGDGIGVTTLRCKAASLSSFTQVGSNTGSPLLVNYGSTTASRIQVGPGITFDGNQANAGTLNTGYSPDAPECSPVALWSASLCTVQGIEVINQIGYGIYLNLCTDSSVTGNRVLSGGGSALGTNQQDGIHLNGGSQIRVENNDVDTGTGTAGDDGIALAILSGTATDINITGNMVRSAVNGIRVALNGGSAGNLNITGNTVYASLDGNGVNITSNTTGQTITGLAVTGNVIRNLGAVSTLAYGISVEAPCNGVTIAGNTMKDFQDATGSIGVYVVNGTGAGTCTNVTVEGNTITGLTGYLGIEIGGSGAAMGVTHFSVTGNVCDLSTATASNNPAGVGVYASTYGSITGNTLIGNSDSGSVAVYLSNGTTKVSVVGNNALNFGYGCLESGTGTQDQNSIGLNSFQGCTTALSLLGQSTASMDAQEAPGQIVTEQAAFPNSTKTLTANTSAQALFNVSSSGQLNIKIGVWFFECEFDLTSLSASTHTVEFGLGGTATVNAIKYHAMTNTGAAGTLAAWNSLIVTSASATALMAAGTSTTFQGLIRGIIRISAAGTLIPQVTQLTNGAAAVVGANSWFKIGPIDQQYGITALYTGNWT